MKTIEELRNTPRLIIEQVSRDGFSGEIQMLKWTGSVICTTGAGWEHVSVSPYKHHITPSWEDMCKIKSMFWRDDEAVIQIHPPKADYVNNMPNCLHLWRCTYKDMVLPPSVLVGVRKNQSGSEFLAEIKSAYEMAGEECPYT